MLSALFKNLKFRNKIFLICLAVSLVPVSILGFFSYRHIHSLLIDREKAALTESLAHETTTINNKINEYETIMKNILYNDNIRQALKRSYDSNYELFLLYRDTLDPFISNMKHFNININEITIYSNLNLHTHGNVHRYLNEIEDKPWYSVILNTSDLLWICSEKGHTLSIVGYFPGLKKEAIAIVQIDIDYDSVFSSLSGLYEQSYGILMIDSNGAPIYEFYTEDMQNYTLTSEQLISAFADPTANPDYIIEKGTIDLNDWRLYLYRPAYTVTSPAFTMAKTIFLVILFCVFLVTLMSSILSKTIVQPLEQLTANMQQLQQENYDVTIIYDSRDEIGSLVSNFKSMATHMNHLINEILKVKILQQKYEMQALQAQINPHFLYNSLSLINSKAILSGQKEIAQTAQFLSTFYRTTLNKGKNSILVKDELENVRSYINIQLMMHSNSFDVSYDIDENILSYTIINLLLQPLVENAIIHGIDHIQNQKRGLLKIIGKQDTDYIIFQVSDNGSGIPDKQLDTILTVESNGYGVKNVHARIQLFYGPQYGLTYQSSCTSGTIATLTLPKNMCQPPK